MMKYLFMLFFMIPTCFNKKYFLLIQFYFLILIFLFFISFSYNYLVINMSYFLGADLLSYLMILLSLWICSLMILASFNLLKMNAYFDLFLLTMLFMMISLFLLFSSLNLFIFYLFFEMSLIPTLILILGWGYQPERLQAGFYLLFYTMFASLPMMISIFFIYYKNNSFDFYYLEFINSSLLFICLNLVFFIKLPMYFIHLWLPKAHVEAPVSGSMILAGIMLKLGGYGLIRFLIIFSNLFNLFNLIFISVSILGGVFVSLICLRQSDVKSLIAYSSVAHMGLVLGGIMTMTCMGFMGSIVMMIAHGLSSSGLFCLANIGYERLHSRSFYIMKGLMNVLPSLSLWWFLFSACNMASPPSLNLLGEIMLINSLISWSSFSMFFLFFMSFFSACYSLYLYSYTQHGKLWSSLMSFSFIKIREYLLLVLHWLPLNLLIIKGDIFIY